MKTLPMFRRNECLRLQYRSACKTLVTTYHSPRCHMPKDIWTSIREDQGCRSLRNIGSKFQPYCMASHPRGYQEDGCITFLRNIISVLLDSISWGQRRRCFLYSPWRESPFLCLNIMACLLKGEIVNQRRRSLLGYGTVDTTSSWQHLCVQ